MEKALNRLHRQILNNANCGNGTLGALVIVGTAATPEQGKVTSFSGGNTTPIVMGLVKEMKRDPSMLAAVRAAVAIVDNNLTEQN